MRAGMLLGSAAALAAVIVTTAAMPATVDAMRCRVRPGPGPEWTDFALRPSHHGRYRAEVEAHRGALRTGCASSWTVRLTTPEGLSVDDATITALGWSPDHETTLPRRMHAQPLDRPGTYRLDGLAFPQPGFWSVGLTIAAPAGTDSLAFNVGIADPSGQRRTP